jgi:hypothetical protein
MLGARRARGGVNGGVASILLVSVLATVGLSLVASACGIDDSGSCVALNCGTVDGATVPDGSSLDVAASTDEGDRFVESGERDSGQDADGGADAPEDRLDDRDAVGDGSTADADADAATDAPVDLDADADADGAEAADGADAADALDAGGEVDVQDAANDSMADATDADAGCDTTKDPKDEPCLLGDAYGIFVSQPGGSDLNAGTRSAPAQTIAKGIALAQGGGFTRVFVCVAPYVGQLSLAPTTDGTPARRRPSPRACRCR